MAKNSKATQTTPQKLTMIQNDQIKENFEKLKTLFPQYVTEVVNPERGG